MHSQLSIVDLRKGGILWIIPLFSAAWADAPPPRPVFLRRIGGKNDFLGIAYIVVGCVCLFLSLVRPRPRRASASQTNRLRSAACAPSHQAPLGALDPPRPTAQPAAASSLVTSILASFCCPSRELTVVLLCSLPLFRCFLLPQVFTIIVLARPREFGDPSYLSWNKYKDQ